MKENKFWELLVFTQKEKKGILILVSILLIAIIFELLLPYLYQPSPVNFSEWENETDQFLAAQPQIPKENPCFNPNKVDSVQLIALGLSPSTASHWIHYLQMGGRFKTKEDIKKIYGMTDPLYQHLEPFISMPLSREPLLKLVVKRDSYPQNNPVNLARKFSIRHLSQLDLNEADSITLEKLPGIGPVLASRIIRFRKILGGFYSVDQLKDVYGLRPEHFLAASPFLFVKEKEYNRINLNFSSFSEMVRHPYIGYDGARRIFKWKDQHGKISSVDDLGNLMREDSLKKLRPYLVFD